MPILNYTTKVDYSKTIGEINSILSKRGIRKIVTDYDNEGMPVALTFSMSINANTIFYSMPCNYEGVKKAILKEGKKIDKAQALRISWRIIKDWIEAQMAIVDAQLAVLPEVFLPYAVTPSGETFFKMIQSGDNNYFLTE